MAEPDEDKNPPKKQRLSLGSQVLIGLVLALR